MDTTLGPVGFIGLGVMGEPMCRNVAQRSGRPVIAYDLALEPLERLAAHGVTAAGSAAAVMRAADIVMLVLPGGVSQAGVRLGAQTRQRLTEDDAVALAAGQPGAAARSPMTPRRPPASTSHLTKAGVAETPPPTTTADADEAAVLHSFLEYYRSVFIRKVEGIDETQARLTLRGAPSTLRTCTRLPSMVMFSCSRARPGTSSCRVMACSMSPTASGAFPAQARACVPSSTMPSAWA